MSSFWSFLAENYILLSIPIISALVGWITNVIALKMTFYPVKYWGIEPFIGWQGIIPAKARVMAEKSVDLMTDRLIDVQELFSRLDAKVVAKEMHDELYLLSKKIVDYSARSQLGIIWKTAPIAIKRNTYRRIAQRMPTIVIEMMDDLREHIRELFNIKLMVQDALTLDRDLLNNIFLKVGDKEFKFIERSGLLFGGLFGIIQMIIAYFFNPWWVMPLAGIVVGYLTNYLALKLIFEPVKPIRIFGISFQGLFIKRQEQASKEYAHIITDSILTIPRIFDSIIEAHVSERLDNIIRDHVEEALNELVQSESETLTILANSTELGAKHYNVVKEIAVWTFHEEFPIIMSSVYDYAEKALAIEETIYEKMSSLPPEEFQGFLRPVFQEDEWKLILVGAILGGFAGLLQSIFIY